MASLPNQGKGTHANCAALRRTSIIQKLTRNSIELYFRYKKALELSAFNLYYYRIYLLFASQDQESLQLEAF